MPGEMRANSRLVMVGKLEARGLLQLGPELAVLLPQHAARVFPAVALLAGGRISVSGAAGAAGLSAGSVPMDRQGKREYLSAWESVESARC